MTDWNTETIAVLTKYFNSGITHELITQAMNRDGYRVTRNGVIGKIHRLGLVRDNATRSGPSTKKLRCARRPPRTAYRPAKPVKRANPPGTPEPAPKGTNKPGKGCQWIHGDWPKIQFCDHHKVRCSSWCSHHYQRVIEPAKPRQRKSIAA